MTTTPPLPLRALATDYDGTLAHNGAVNEATLAALKRLKEAGLKLILVTGRETNELISIFPELTLFDLAVMENGAVLLDPVSGEMEALAEPPSRSHRHPCEALLGPASAATTAADAPRTAQPVPDIPVQGRSHRR